MVERCRAYKWNNASPLLYYSMKAHLNALNYLNAITI